MKDINDIIFLGFNSSFSIPSLDSHGYEGNRIDFFRDELAPMSSIYFTDEMTNGCNSNVRVFNLANQSIEDMPSFKYNPQFPCLGYTLSNFYACLGVQERRKEEKVLI